MTKNIENFINKWVMRVKEARTVLTVGLWSVMAMVQVLGFLRPYLIWWQMITVAVLMAIGGVTFTYLYDKLQIMKGEQMERVNRKSNFVGEDMVLNHLGMIHFFSKYSDMSRDEMMEEYAKFLEQYRNGVRIEDVKKQGVSS